MKLEFIKEGIVKIIWSPSNPGNEYTKAINIQWSGPQPTKE
jgi:hypothetical protein